MQKIMFILGCALLIAGLTSCQTSKVLREENTRVTQRFDKGKGVVVLDFDGTICDSYNTVIELFNSHAQEFHYKQIPHEKFASLRNVSSREWVGQMGMERSVFPDVVKKVIADLHSKVNELKPISGVKEAIEELRKNGYRVGVLTSNSEKSVKKFAANHKLQFDFIYGDGSLFAKHELMGQLISDMGASKDQVIYVGDETRDIEAARKAGIKVVAVDWGFNSTKALKAFRPDWIVPAPSKLIKVVSSLWPRATKTNKM